MGEKRWMGTGRRKLVVMATAFALSASGTTAITVAIAAEPRASQPLRAASDRFAARATPIVTALAPASPEPRVPAEPGPEDPRLALPTSEPTRIDIPAIEVRSPLQQVGLTAQHTMQAPAPGPHYNEAAWYKHSSTPGSPGPAVIIGHVDSAAEGPSVFFNLGKLQKGDEVLVTRADGQVAVFRVDEIGRYPKADFPTQLVYGDTESPALRLITCGGAFDAAAGHYLDNIVVFATLVGTK